MTVLSPAALAAAHILRNAEHPLSIGWRIGLVSNSRWVKEGARCSTEHVVSLMSTEADAYSYTFPDPKMYLIVIPDLDATLGRHLEICVHEASHVVDYIFKTAGIVEADTELRAYYLDWLFESLLDVLPDSLSTLRRHDAIPEAPTP